MTKGSFNLRLELFASLAAGAFVLAAAPALAAPSDELVAAAKKEGQLTVIALPHDWCGYGPLIDGFKAKYGLTVNELNPDGGSGDEIEAIKANKDNKGPQAPDVIDVGLSFGPSAKKDGLLHGLQSVDLGHDPGYGQGRRRLLDRRLLWRAVVRGERRHRQDRRRPTGPTCSSPTTRLRSRSPAIRAPPTRRRWRVYAAGLASGETDAAKAAADGPRLLRQPQQERQFRARDRQGRFARPGRNADRSPLGLQRPRGRDSLKGNPKVEVVVPKSGVVAGVYVQAISAYAPHPNAAKLWLETLYSDEGQLGWLKGYCHPIRFNNLVDAKKVPADLLAALPPAAGYAKAKFPSLDEQAAAKDVIAKQWDAVVGATVAK